jgi:ribosomal protein S12 methylthiotransferase accessory factor
MRSRERTPEETVALLRPYLPALGVTRVANVTGLDRVGIPVFMAVRPNSRSLAVAQGKGITLEAARVSALMESLEAHHAERPRCSVRIETRSELARQVPVTDPGLLPRVRGSAYSDNVCLPWVEARDCVTAEPLWVPYELVHANATVPRVPGSGNFVCSTNGLASGNTRSEALLHAVCEVVERDALALWERRTSEERAKTRLDIDTVTNPLARSLLDQFATADISVMVWDMTTNIGLPALRAVVIDSSAELSLNPIPAAGGFGCDPDPVIALVRALTEAAQSRVTIIAGSRDDLARERYRRTQQEAVLVEHRRTVGQGGYIDAARLPSLSIGTVDGDLGIVLDRLGASGFARVAVVDLTRPDIPAAVVRVIVPGLEGPTESPAYTPGPRARAWRP